MNQSTCIALRVKFEEMRTQQMQLVSTHEAANNYGMAYLATWAVLESFAKQLGPLAQRQQLNDSLLAWIDYVNEFKGNPPAKIGQGKFDLPKEATEKIPAETQLQRLIPLESAPQFYLAITAKKKYRDRRNNIAHFGAEVSKKVYEEFKEVAVAAIIEVENWLSECAK